MRRRRLIRSVIALSVKSVLDLRSRTIRKSTFLGRREGTRYSLIMLAVVLGEERRVVSLRLAKIKEKRAYIS